MTDPNTPPATPDPDPAPLPPEILRPDPGIIREVTTGVVIDQVFDSTPEA